MSTQLTIRIASESAQFVDDTVANGAFTSRADYLDWLIRREIQRQRALADLTKLHTAGALPNPYPDLAGIADTAHEPLDLD